MAKELGTFARYEVNSENMLRVIRNHRRAVYNVDNSEYEGLSITPKGIIEKDAPEYLLKAARAAWDDALAMGEEHGYRNAQSTVIAPTGTIGLIMDCDTTGIEPDFALVKFKKLAGGGYFKIANKSVIKALKNLGYSKDQSQSIIEYLIGSGSLENSPYINRQSLAAKGFTPDIIKKIEAGLATAFDINYAFNRYSIGDEFLKGTLGISDAQLDDFSFNLLAHLGLVKKKSMQQQNLSAVL